MGMGMHRWLGHRAQFGHCALNMPGLPLCGCASAVPHHYPPPPARCSGNRSGPARAGPPCRTPSAATWTAMPPPCCRRATRAACDAVPPPPLVPDTARRLTSALPHWARPSPQRVLEELSLQRFLWAYSCLMSRGSVCAAGGLRDIKREAHAAEADPNRLPRRYTKRRFGSVAWQRPGLLGMPILLYL